MAYKSFKEIQARETKGNELTRLRNALLEAADEAQGVDQVRDFIDKTTDEDKKMKVKKLANKIVELGLKEDLNLYYACESAGILGENDAVLARIRQQDEDADYYNFDLCKFAVTYGNEEDKNRGMRMFCGEKRRLKNLETFDMGMEHICPEIRELCDRIRGQMQQYTEKFELDDRFVGSPHVNAAVQIVKLDYDLIVGIQGGCSNLTNVLEFIGDDRLRYINYSKSLEKLPVWEKIGRSRKEVEKAKKILICENDAVSGQTLRSVQPLIEKLQPEGVDICFSGGFFDEKSQLVAEQMGIYKRIFSVMNMDFDNFLENIREASRKGEVEMSRLF